MLKNSIKYTLTSLLIFGAVGCTPPRTIIIPTQTQPQRQVVHPPKKEPIKEEILLGRGKNPSLGNRIDVPVNNPSIGNPIGEEGNTPIVEDKNQTNLVEPEVREERGVIERIPFPVDEYRHLAKRGSSTLSGKIYLENVHTGEKYTKGKIKLWLNPVTTYSQQWYRDSYLGGYKLTKSDSRLYNYLKFTYSNSDGSFNFFGLPRGSYYLTATISCAEECGYSSKNSILLVKEVSIGRGRTNVELMKSVP